MKIIAADIGGTNCRLVMAEKNANTYDILHEKYYLSADYTSLIELINVFLQEHDNLSSIDAACFAVAGPIKEDIASITNLPWVISKKELIKVLKTPNIKLVNDFFAAAYGATELTEEDYTLLYQGTDLQGVDDAAIIGAGTGLGVAQIRSLNKKIYIFPSESGHVGFAPQNTLQCELLSWLQKSHKYVSLEMILSGCGLMKIYNFLREVKNITESEFLIKKLKTSNCAEVISYLGLMEQDELCIQTLNIFVDIYATAASNTVLNYFPIKTLYIGGGIAPKIKEKMLSQRFIDIYMNKGNMSYILENVTIKLITNDKTGLSGSISIAFSS